MADTAVQAHNITKRYKDTVALDDVSLSVAEGTVYGLIGPNGAGKTTLLGVLARMRTPTAGSFSIGSDRVSVLPDTPKFEPWLTARETVALSRDLSPESAERWTMAAIRSRGRIQHPDRGW